MRLAGAVIDGARSAGDDARVSGDEDDRWSYTGVPRWVAIAFAVVVGVGLLAGMISALTQK